MSADPLQLDLFAERPRSPTDHLDDWAPRLLADMADGPIVACFPGYTGAMLERLVERGLAVREDAGFMDPLRCLAPGLMTPAKLRAYERDYWKDPAPQFRYSLAPHAR